ncbi:unnamed protein product, partial [Prorocentrum cordatum]
MAPPMRSGAALLAPRRLAPKAPTPWARRCYVSPSGGGGGVPVIGGVAAAFGAEAPGRSGAAAAPRWHVGLVVVPQQIAWVVERLGKFHK